MFNNKLNKYLNKINKLRGGGNTTPINPVSISSGGGDDNGNPEPLNNISINIIFNSPPTDSFKLDVNNYTKISKIKDLILRKTNYNTYKQKLYYNGNLLEDTNNISNYGINNNDNIHVEAGLIKKINVSDLTGKIKFDIIINADYDTCADIWNKVMKYFEEKNINTRRNKINLVINTPIPDVDKNLNDWLFSQGVSIEAVTKLYLIFRI